MITTKLINRTACRIRLPLMLSRITKLPGLICFMLMFPLSGNMTATAQEKPENLILLNLDDTGTVISKDIYGHFAEHLGRCIYDGIWVGEESPIPNVKGYRTDILTALKDMGIPVLRWPGGCFADTYHWRDGIGPRNQRASIINVNWGGVTEDNSFGTHEFLDLCELLGCDAYISGNVGSGTVREMAEWAEYMTSANESPMTKLRAQNGRKEPWKVKYFGIGNEAWGCGGQMTAEYYSDLCRQYGTYLNYAGNGVTKIASGASESDYHWTDVVMKNVGSRVEGVSLHYYTLPGDWSAKGSSTDFDESGWYVTMRKTMLMDSLIANHVAIMDRYDKEHRLFLAVDEWGTWYDVIPGTNPGFLYQQNTLRDAMVAAINLNIFNNHADRVRMANIAQMVNVLQAVILTRDDKIVLTPTYHVFRMYKVHQDATLIPVTLTSRMYRFNGGEIPSISVSASRDSLGVINITIANIDPDNTCPVTIDLVTEEAGKVSGEILTAESVNSYNDFDDDHNVYPCSFDAFHADGHTLRVDLPARSVVRLRLE